VQTVRAECLDWLLIVGRGHLEQALRVYVAHYNIHRPMRDWLSSAKISWPLSTDAICSAVCCTSTGELHEHLCVPHTRLRPMRGLKQDRSARVVIAGHAFVQNLRRGHYELAVEKPTNRRVAVAFDELVLAI
jgi:hypothetical protein